MMQSLKRIVKANEGQALILTLVLLLVGALLVPASLAYMGTSLKAKIVAENKLDELYAADAGIEYALCRIEEDEEVPTSLPQPVNDLSVTLLPVEAVPCDQVPSTAGYYHSYTRKYTPSGHGYYEEDKGTLPGVLEIGTEIDGWSYDYLYQITVTNNSEEPMPLTKLVACLPTRFEYRSCSGYLCEDNITHEPPPKSYRDNWYGGIYQLEVVTWELAPPVVIAAGETRKQNFWMWFHFVAPLPCGYYNPPSPNQLTYYTLADGGTGGDILVITAEAGNTTLKVCVVKWVDTEESEEWRSMFPDLKIFSILSWEYE